MPDKIIIEGARIIFRNFSGAAKKFNAAGDRNFSVVLDEETALNLKEDGWNVQIRQPRDDDGETDERPFYHLPVKVQFKGRPPKVVMVTHKGRTHLTEDMLELLDYADIKSVDVAINPFEWDVQGKKGVKAYLSSIFAVIDEDALDIKYSDTPIIPA